MTHNYVCVCPRQNCQVRVCVTLADDHRAVGHPVSIWGSGHFLPEMSWSTHPLWSLISTFFLPSLIFLQAKEYLWQALYFIDGMSVCKLIFMHTPQWIYNIQHAASSAYRLKVLQRDKMGSGVHTGWPHFLSWYVLCVFPFYTHLCSLWRPWTEPLLQTSTQEPAVLLVHWHVHVIQREERDLLMSSSWAVCGFWFLSPAGPWFPACPGCFPVTWLAASCSHFFPKVLLHTHVILGSWITSVTISISLATKHAVNQLQDRIYCLPPSLIIHACSRLINTGKKRSLRVILFHTCFCDMPWIDYAEMEG